MSGDGYHPLGLSEETSRRAVLAAMLGAGIGAGATPAFAGWLPGASLGLEVTTPKDADRDDELLGTAKVQASLKNLNTYKSSAVAMRASFQKDTNAALIPAIRKYFDFAVLRTDLNTLGSVFDDQTQETLDRLARSVLYDLTELENASRFKKGSEPVRTAKMVEQVDKWFGKLDTDFDQVLAYFK